MVGCWWVQVSQSATEPPLEEAEGSTRNAPFLQEDGAEAAIILRLGSGASPTTPRPGGEGPGKRAHLNRSHTSIREYSCAAEACFGTCFTEEVRWRSILRLLRNPRPVFTRVHGTKQERP